MRTLRKLLLGETWTLPLGVALTIVLGALADLAIGDDAAWRHGGGWALLALLAIALWAAVRR